MKYFLLIISTIVFLSNSLIAQYTNVQISNVQSPNEPSIMINPKNTNQVVAGANIASYYYSTNGGLTWTRGVLTSSLYGVWGDPCIIVDTTGAFYFFHLSNPPGPAWIDRIVCQKSTNGGMSWNDPGSYTFHDPNKEQDKEWACVDRTNNYIYVTWTQFDSYGSSSQLDSSNILFARSTNGGDTWDIAKRINQLGGDCVDDDNTVEGAVPCVGPNGEVYVSWAGPKIRNSQFGIFFDKSTDKGQTWLNNDIYVTDQPGGWAFDIPGIYRCNGMPITSCDISGGPHHGTIYINWSDQRNGTTNTDVWLVKSTNGGQNWSTPKRVNDDPAGKQQFFTWMDIDQTTGYLYFVFYDRRNHSNNLTDVYIARSTDGGTTFENIIISATPFLPVSGFFGDYSCISAHDNKVRPIWARLDGSTPNISVWTAIIDFPANVINITTNIPSEYHLGQNFPNPFNPTTSIKFDIPGSTFTKIKIYDILGKEIATLVSEELSAGSYEVEWDASEYTSGIYMYKLITNDFSETKKMLLIK
ncbi:MAG: T9SS type A sorting domain-containing protein [Bacteroidetes bacterium]|nr:T9SS type A sorting domain-containing protein [Bacteroidota bacterium]